MNRDPDADCHSLMRVAVRRLSDGSLADQIRWSAEIEEAAGLDLAQRIALARRNNLLTWGQIATAIGTKPQSAHRRFKSGVVESEDFALEIQTLMAASELIGERLLEGYRRRLGR